MKTNFQIIMPRNNVYGFSVRKKNKDEFMKMILPWFDGLEDVYGDCDFKLNQNKFKVGIAWKTFIRDFLYHLENDIILKDILEDGYEFHFVKKDEAQDSTYESPEFEIEHEKYYKDISTNKYCTIDCVIEHDLKKDKIGRYIAIIFFHIWRCLNLALPGILNLGNSKITVDGIDEMDLNLNSTILSNIFTDDVFKEYPLVHIINVSDVWEWYINVMNIADVVTTNSLERAVTGLFKLEQGQIEFNQANIVWIFLGIEALYSLNGGGILDKLRKRSSLLLDIHEKEKKGFMKILNNFYNYRSRFVHGDKEILTYISDIYFFEDDTVDSEYKKYHNIEQFGVYLLISSIQKLIIDKKQKLEFKEVIC